MDNRIIIFILTLFLIVACAGTDYDWSSVRNPDQSDYTEDLETCRAYTAAQYQPGMPKGAEYLDEYQGYPHGMEWDGPRTEIRDYKQGEWRPDRNPFQQTNINQTATHDVTVPYTGYPGYYDYSPGYLDDILEKCMRDRGWEYQAVPPAGD